MGLNQVEKNLAIKVVILIAVLYGLVWASNKYIAEFTNTERSTNSNLKEELQDFQQRLGQIQVEEQLQTQYVSEYNQFQSAGRIISEAEADRSSENEEIRRLELLTKLKDIINARQFFEANYTLSSPENLPQGFTGETEASTILIRSTRMDITMSLLHSLDILMLINDFYDEQTNRFVPIECTLQLTNDALRSGSQQDRRLALFEVTENIEATCGLVWLSVFDPELEKVEGEDESA